MVFFSPLANASPLREVCHGKIQLYLLIFRDGILSCKPTHRLKRKYAIRHRIEDSRCGPFLFADASPEIKTHHNYFRHGGRWNIQYSFLWAHTWQVEDTCRKNIWCYGRWNRCCHFLPAYASFANKIYHDKIQHDRWWKWRQPFPLADTWQVQETWHGKLLPRFP